MRYVKLGKTELTVSEFGFGCIPIIRLSKEDAVKVLHALKQGINYFDTANAYCDSEEKIGTAFEGMRTNVVIPSLPPECLQPLLQTSVKNQWRAYCSVRSEVPV